MTRRTWRRVVIGALGLTAAAGGGAGMGRAGASAPPDGTVPGGAAVSVGDASAIVPAVDLQVVGAEFAPLAEAVSAPVAVGDVLRTDATGYAEVAYLDGSRTRLDVDTEFTVLALVDAAGNADTRTEMGLGRTWHRVESVGQGDGGFSVETSVATATVTGTAFAIECVAADSCRFVVVEGAVQLALPDGSVVDLVAPSAVDVVNGVAGPIAPATFDDAFGDPWLLDNGVRDAAVGFADPATVYLAHGPAFASMAGEFTVTGTVTDATCAAACFTGWALGDTIEFSVSVGSSASSWTETTSQPCGLDEDGDAVIDRETGLLTQTDSYSVTPTASELRDGIPQVTAFTGTRTTEIAVGRGACAVDGSDFGGQSWTVEIEGRR